tara:strand:+ start:13414 stop:13674 length:261 start_codon:yes stop_codon:yes gene_type:complete
MERQVEILKVFKDTEEVLSKKEIKERSGISYYYNTDKHLGDILSRMVNNGLLVRPKKGHYKWSGRTTPNHLNKDVIQPKEQQKLNL